MDCIRDGDGTEVRHQYPNGLLAWTRGPSLGEPCTMWVRVRTDSTTCDPTSRWLDFLAPWLHLKASDWGK